MFILISLTLGFLLPLFPRAVGGVFLWLSLPYFSDGNGLLGIISLVIAEGISGGIKSEGRNSYCYAKVIGLIACIFLTLCNVQDTLKIPLSQQTLGIYVLIFIGWRLVSLSKNKVGAVIGVIGAIALGQIGSNLHIPNAIMAMSISMYGIPPIVASLLNVEKEKEKSGDDIDITGFVLGIPSALFMGIPPSALALSVQEDQDKAELQGSSEGISSAFSLLIAVAGLGSRSTVADNTALASIMRYTRLKYKYF